jgi:RNA polymerase sigma-70 factor, ECF subfamily
MEGEERSMAAAEMSASPPDEGPPVEDDEAVLSRLQGGDRRGALMLCARLHGPALGRLCMALTGSQADAEDLAQETLIEAHKALDGWRQEGSLRAFLMTIARRKCAKHLEKRSRRTARLRLVHDAERTPISAEAEKMVLLRQRADQARAALETVRPSEREALLLRFGAGLSFREVAIACGIDEAAARKRVSRAIARLRESLEEGKRP